MRGNIFVAIDAAFFSSPEWSSGEGDRKAVVGPPSVLPRFARQSTSPALRAGEESDAS